MPHNHLQDALAYLHTLYATYEAQGITITGSRMPLTQYANFAAMKYLLFLANQDRVITDAETNFINNCLQQSATTQTMERFLQQFSISFSGAADSLLALLAALVRVDLQGSGVKGSISLLWLETIAQMGTQFSLNTAGKIEPQQQIVQNSMMQQLSRYRDAAMRGCRRPELEKAAVIPANFNAEKTPIPAEKEAVVDDAEITEAPTETLDELLARLTAVCGKCGLTLTKNQGIALLLLLAMSDRIGIVSSTPAPAATLIRNIAAAMGWERSFAHQISAEQRPMVALRPVDATPVLLLTSLPNYAPISGMHKLLLSRSSIGLTRNAAYDAGQWPILPLPALPFIPELPADDAAPISQATLTALLDATSVAKTSDEEITAVLSPIFAMVSPLSGAARAEMYRFIRVAAALMEGGLPVALDFAILLWVVPMVDRTSRNFADFKALLDEYPLSQAKL